MRTLHLKIETNGISHSKTIEFGSVKMVKSGQFKDGVERLKKEETIDVPKLIADCTAELIKALTEAGYSLPSSPAPAAEAKRSKRSE